MTHDDFAKIVENRLKNVRNVIGNFTDTDHKLWTSEYIYEQFKMSMNDIHRTCNGVHTLANAKGDINHSMQLGVRLYARMCSDLMRSNFKDECECMMDHIEKTLIVKGKEYATDDVFHNFKTASKLYGCGFQVITHNEEFTTIAYDHTSPSGILWGYMLKHLMSIDDMVKGVKKYTTDSLLEKFGDVLVYLSLLEGLFEEYKVVTEKVKNSFW